MVGHWSLVCSLRVTLLNRFRKNYLSFLMCYKYIYIYIFQFVKKWYKHLQLESAIDHCWPLLLRSLDKYGINPFRNLLILHLDSITSLPWFLIYGSLMSKIFSIATFKQSSSPKHRGSVCQYAKPTLIPKKTSNLSISQDPIYYIYLYFGILPLVTNSH